MRRALFGFILSLFAIGAWAASVSLTWTASPTANVTYNVYRNGTAITNTAALAWIDAAPPSATVKYFLTAQSAEGVESDPSNEVTLNLGKPGAPASLRAVFNR